DDGTRRCSHGRFLEALRTELPTSRPTLRTYASFATLAASLRKRGARSAKVSRLELPRRARAVVEPRAVTYHACSLIGGRASPAGFQLLAVRRGSPAHLDAVVGIVGDLERLGPGEHVAEGERPARAVAARVLETPRGRLVAEDCLQLGAHVRRRSIGCRGEALGSLGSLLGEAAHDIDRDEKSQVTRRRRVVLPRTRGLEDRGALGHRDRPRERRHERLAVGDRADAGPDLLLQRVDRGAEGYRRIQRLGREYVIDPIVEPLHIRLVLFERVVAPVGVHQD